MTAHGVSFLNQRVILFSILFFGFLGAAVHAQEPAGSIQSTTPADSNEPLFDQFADWGAPGFPPQIGQNKTLGKMDTTQSPDGLIYDIYGNGDGFHDQNDEGYFVYTERPGSWTLTLKTEWIDDTGGNTGAVCGIMIRERGNASDSKFHFIGSARTKAYGAVTINVWRDREGDRGSELRTNVKPQMSIENRGTPTYFRLTRIASENRLYSEYSKDGTDWTMAHQIRIRMHGPIAYGFAIFNYNDNAQLAHARVIQPKLEPAKPFANRLISTDRFLPNDIIDISLAVENPSDRPVGITVQERIPPGWNILRISHGGVRRKEGIIWTLPIHPGSTHLMYTAQPTAQSENTAVFSGQAGTMEIRGANVLCKSKLNINETRAASNFQTLFTVVPLSMLVLHLCLFLFYPRLKENLHYALYLGSLTALRYLELQSTFLTDISQIFLYWRLFFTFNSLNLIFVLLFFYYLVYDRLPRQYWIFFTGAILAAIGFWIRDNETILPICLAFYLIGCGECLRVVIIAILRRREGIEYIAFGAIIFNLSIIWKLLVNLSLAPALPIPYQTEWALLLFILSMSVYLSARFAKANKTLAELNVDLEYRVEQRTEELENANEDLQAANFLLEGANEQLRELDKMKTAFVSQASHDLRTPLTAIKGSLDNLALGIAGEMSPKQLKILSRATRSVDRLTNLVNDILDLSRIESGRTVLEKSNIPLRTLVQNTIQEQHPAAAQKGIELRMNKVSDLFTVLADGGKIQRVIGELVSNAIKYTPEGGKIEITLEQSGDMISLSVTDTGMGMTKEECGKIWNRFYRTPASQQVAKGSGLGLSIAKELVIMHKGTLTAESEPGKGTTVTMRLPNRNQNTQ